MSESCVESAQNLNQTDIKLKKVGLFLPRYSLML